MKIAIQNPHYFISRSEKTFHAYDWFFLKNHSNIIFFYKLNLISLVKLVRWVCKNTVPIWRYKIVFKAKTLNKLANVLICFNGRPDLDINCPPLTFKGLKIAHVVDYSFYAKKAYENLSKNCVHYIMGSSDHGKYDNFFQCTYPNYINKCISVPFSYSSRFIRYKSFNNRINKCIALGSVNLIRDSMCSEDSLHEYIKYFESRNEKWAHKFRRMIFENLNFLKEEIDSLLPEQGKNLTYNIVETYNNYRMFTSCESVMFYPSVKTFEGCASGAALICSDHPCFTELGFKDGENCIKYKQYNIIDFKNKIQYYQKHSRELERIANNGYLHITNHFNPTSVALMLFRKVCSIYKHFNI